MGGEDNTFPVYKEETWGKDVGGEYITDGYKYIGKTAFKIALDGLKDKMVRGAKGEINKIEYTVLDKRPAGTGLDIDIQVKENNSRGNAFLKLYGPSKKKQNVVLVTRSKGNDSKFMKILAEQVIKPLIDQILASDEIDQIQNTKNSVSVAEKEAENTKCQFCHKTFLSESGLKSHITRMHKKEKNRKRQLCESNDLDEHIHNEAKKVIDIIVDDMNKAETEDMSEDSKEITLNETLGSKDEKKYTSDCESCDFVAVASRKYITLKMLKIHKESCPKEKMHKIKINQKCEICNFEEYDYTVFKKHMRDQHGKTTVSTSPPLKRKREVPVVKLEESMDCIIDDENEEDLKLEDMDIDDNESEILSKRMDKKITEKAKEDEEKEKLNKQKLEETKEKKKKIEEGKRFEDKRNKKKEKQNRKDVRKMSNKKSKKGNEKLKANKIEISNIKEVPKNCQHLVGVDDVIYQVPGNGACAPNSAAAHLFSDELFGPKLRRQMNIFMSKLWDRHYKYKTQCSDGHPFIRKIGDSEIRFTNPEELKEFLLKSEDASYMWSDSEDLCVISDMFQIRIKVITSRGINDEDPTANWIYPEETLKQFAELKDVDLKDMVLFHENDCHFNLVINKNDDLAKFGSLSNRLNVVPTFNASDKNDEDKKIEEYEKVNIEASDHESCKKELKRCEEMNRKLRREYSTCENELKNKTEEVEKLKIEISVMKQILNLQTEKEVSPTCSNKNQLRCEICKLECISETDLRNHKKSEHTNFMIFCERCHSKFESKTEVNRHVCSEHRNSMQDDKVDTNSEQQKANLKYNMKTTWSTDEEMFDCNKCPFNCKSKAQLNNHMQWKHTSIKQTEKEFNCDGCDYQGTTRFQLNKHKNLKHIEKDQPKNEVIRCRNCDEQFSEKWNLMYHRKQKHIQFVAYCKKKIEGNCPFSDEKCWWNHQNKNKASPLEIECFICGEIFESKSSLMRHRKLKHPTLVKRCDKFIKNDCQFQDSYCWWLHEEEAMELDESTNDDKKEEDEKENSLPVFQKPSLNIKPPFKKQKEE